MRIWFGGPRIMGVRTGVSFGPEDFRKRERAYSASAATLDVGSFVYVIAGDHGLTKIGVSSNPNARLAQLRTASPFPLRFSLICAVSGDAYAVEAAAHELLGRNRMDGEWFDVTPELAMSAVTGAASKVGLKLQPVDPGMVDVVRRTAQETAPERLSRPRNPWIRRINILSATIIALVAIFIIVMANYGGASR